MKPDEKRSQRHSQHRPLPGSGKAKRTGGLRHIGGIVKRIVERNYRASMRTARSIPAAGLIAGLLALDAATYLF